MLSLYASDRAVSLYATNIRVLDNCIETLYTSGTDETSCLLQMRSYRGLHSMSDLSEVRRCNFVDQLTDNGNHAVLLKVSCENMC